MDPKRRKVIIDFDGYVTEPQIGLWLASDDVDAEAPLNGDPAFETYICECKKYNYLYDLSLEYPSDIVLSWDEKGLAFFWDEFSFIGKFAEDTLETIDAELFRKLGENPFDK